MKLLNPVQRIRQQKVADFAARIIKNVRAPLGVIAESRILVLVAGRPVEAAQGPVVFRKMRRHPIQQHTDARLVHRIHERAEIIGCPMTRRRREVAAHLVAPRSAKRMLEHRKQFDVREPHALHMFGQSRRELAIRQQAVVLTAHPRREVHFVHEHRFAQRVGVGALRQPRAILPFVRVARLHNRRVPGTRLHLKRVRIGLHAQRPTRRPDLELVHRFRAHTGHEQFEHAAGSEAPHLMRPSVPVVERADHRHARGVRRPHRERRAGHTVDLEHVRAQLLPQTEVPSLVEEMKIHLAERRKKPVRIVAQHDAPIAEGDLEAIAHRGGAIAQEEREQSVLVAYHGPPLFTEHQGDRRRVGLKGADRDAIHPIEGDRMHTQHVVRQGGFASNEPPRGVG